MGDRDLNVEALVGGHSSETVNELFYEVRVHCGVDEVDERMRYTPAEWSEVSSWSRGGPLPKFGELLQSFADRYPPGGVRDSFGFRRRLGEAIRQRAAGW